MFDIMIKFHQFIYEMMMNSMRVKKFLFDHEIFLHFEIFKQHLYNQNNHLRFFQNSKNVIYAD